MTKEQIENLERLGLPIVEFLRGFGNPYASVIITEDSILCVTDVAGIPVKSKSDLN